MRLSEENLVEVALWCGASVLNAIVVSARDGREKGERYGYLTIPTLEGMLRAEVGDWVIRGVKGEFYPCKADIFEQTYEPVPE